MLYHNKMNLSDFTAQLFQPLESNCEPHIRFIKSLENLGRRRRFDSAQDHNDFIRRECRDAKVGERDRLPEDPRPIGQLTFKNDYRFVELSQTPCNHRVVTRPIGRSRCAAYLGSS